MMTLAILIGLVLSQMQNEQAQTQEGAWQALDQNGNTHVLILADGHFAITVFNATSKAFGSARGGKFQIQDGIIVETVEFNTLDPLQVGTVQKVIQMAKVGSDLTTADGVLFKRLDDGSPGKLSGAWVITGRMANGELRTMTPGARRTMKILSGTRFQWIAYNVETKEFSGTGGGTYTTIDGKYTENIEFFSRDKSRVGASLSFDFALENMTWRHRGLSSKGEPIDEVWSKRTDIGL